MWKKFITILIVAIAIILFASDAYALQMNLALGKDIVNNKDKLNISYELYFPDSSVVQQIKGMDQQVFVLRLHAFNQENKNMTAIDDQGKSSQISLGYNKNGEDFYPASCQNIRLTGVNTINIALTENGCSVH